MNKKAAIVFIITFSFISGGPAFAKDKKAVEVKQNIEIDNIKETVEQGNQAQEQIEEVKPQVDQAALAEARKKRQEETKLAKEKLGRQEWKIYLTSLADRKAMGSDTLVFSEGKITAKELASKGYQPSSCTITTQEDGVIIWETMQVSENGDRVFWRGELNNNLMQGIISMQPKEGKNQDISFSTVAPKPDEPKIEPKKEEKKKEEKPKKEKAKK